MAAAAALQKPPETHSAHGELAWGAAADGAAAADVAQSLKAPPAATAAAAAGGGAATHAGGGVRVRSMAMQRLPPMRWPVAYAETRGRRPAMEVQCAARVSCVVVVVVLAHFSNSSWSSFRSCEKGSHGVSRASRRRGARLGGGV